MADQLMTCDYASNLRFALNMECFNFHGLHRGINEEALEEFEPRHIWVNILAKTLGSHGLKIESLKCK